MARLAVVTPTFFPEPIGTPLYVTDMAHWFGARGWQVEVITAQPFYPSFRRYPGYGRTRRHDRVGELEVLRLPTIVPREGRAAWRAVGDLNFAMQGVVRSRGRRARTVLSISPGVPWAAVVGRALREQGGRHVALVHDVQSGLARSLSMAGGFEWALRASERASLSLADHVAVLTPEMGEAVAALGVRRPIDVVPVWATVEIYGLPPFERSVQYSGNFGGKQGVHQLAGLAERLQRRDPTVTLVLRGQGRRFEAMRRLLGNGSVRNTVFEIPAEADALAHALARSPVHVVPQAVEASPYTMPSKVINALACGCAVVAMADARSPVRRLAGEVPGITVVPVGDVDAMAGAVLDVLDDPELDSKRERVRVEAGQRFARDHVLGRLEQLVVG